MQSLDQHLDRLRTKLEGPIDFQGQELAELYQRQILWASGVCAFLIGFAFQSLRLLVGVFSLGVLLSLAVTAPAYPCYNRHPVEFLPKLDEYGLAQPSSRALESAKDR